MKYNLKTAVHVTDEFTAQNLIEFFEGIKPDCNEVAGNKDFWNTFDVKIGDTWCIDEYGELSWRPQFVHVIINGITKNWRQEMKFGENTSLANGDPYDVNKDLQSKIDKLETKNKELKECLKNIINYTRQSGNGRNRLNDNKLGKFHAEIEQAKQLLNN